jgi:hypothetical protein
VSVACPCGGNRPGPPCGAGSPPPLPPPPSPLPPLPPPPLPPLPSGHLGGGLVGGWNGCLLASPGTWNCQHGMDMLCSASGGLAWSEPSARWMFSAVSVSTFMACPMMGLMQM